MRAITLGAYPSRGIVTAEARLGAMVAGTSAHHALVGPAMLTEGAGRAMDALASLGVVADGPVVARRADLAAELWFTVGGDGIAFLNACAQGLHLPRLAQRVYSARGEARIESILWQTPKGNKTRVRLYDAGVKHGTHPPGQRLRLEVEQRWDGDRTPTPEQLAFADHSAIFGKQIRPWVTGPKPITVGTPNETIRLLYLAVRRGDLKLRTANSLSAKVNVLEHYGEHLAAHDRRRKVRELRRAGIALDLSRVNESRVIDLREPLAALAASWAPRDGASS